MIEFLVDKMTAAGTGLAVAQPDGQCRYDDLLGRLAEWQHWLRHQAIAPGDVVALEGEYGIDVIAIFLALIENRNVVVPLSRDASAHHEAFLRIAEVQHRVTAAGGHLTTGTPAPHEHYRTLRERQHPGLVLFSSGSTGTPKAAVHDLSLLLRKFQTPRHAYRTLVFLLLDHIGGVNTLLYTLANAGAVVVPRARTPLAVCEAIATHRVSLLPTSPTFLNLLLLSGEHQHHDLSSLELITYGTEPMPQSTLDRLKAAFPAAKLLQTYGMTELGILRSQSRGSDSLWVRVGGEGYETKVVDGRLWIRAESAMLGYLNAPAPFDADGFFDTGDLVETDGEWLKILGRKSEVINVGGSKVFPAEVESVLLLLDNVADVAVHGEPHAITGQTVVARVQLTESEPLPAFKVRMRLHCKDRLAAYKIPARVIVTAEPVYSERFKRMR